MLDEAVEHFRDAGCAPPDIRGALKNHYRAADLDLGPDPEPQPEKVRPGRCCAHQSVCVLCSCWQQWHHFHSSRGLLCSCPSSHGILSAPQRSCLIEAEPWLLQDVSDLQHVWYPEHARQSVHCQSMSVCSRIIVGWRFVSRWMRACRQPMALPQPQRRMQ
jgi:hypothetical protein